MIVYLARHGSTELNQQDVLKGWLNVPLDELGRRQAENLADHLAAEDFTHAYCGDLDRTVETANIILRHQPQVALSWELALRPLNFGDLQGRPYKEIEGRLRDLLDLWKQDPTVPAPGGESWADFQGRAFPFIGALLKRRSDARVLVVTHGKLCAYIMAVALNNAKPIFGENMDLLNGLAVDTGNYAVIETDRRPRVVRLNRLEQEKSPTGVLDRSEIAVS